MGNCKAYIIKGFDPKNLDMCFVKQIYSSCFETTACIWFSLFILSLKRANEIKAKCERLSPSINWTIYEVEMSVPKEI